MRFQVIAKEGYLSDLSVNEIELRDNGVPQKIALFEGGKVERSTVTEVHLLFDCSNSVQTAEKFNPHVFEANILDNFPNARIAIWGFSGAKLTNFTPPTSSSKSLNSAMAKVRKMKPGDSPVYQSIAKVADRLANASTEAVRMIVTVSDGMPFNDNQTPQMAVNAAKRAGIALYPALIYSKRMNIRGDQSGYAQQSAFLGIADPSGGRGFEFGGSSAEDLLDRILKGVAEEIRSEYVVGYYPVPAATPRLRKVQVILKNGARGRIVGGARDLLR